MSYKDFSQIDIDGGGMSGVKLSDKVGEGVQAENMATWNQFDRNADYSSLMWEAYGQGRFKEMHIYEQMRNAKIDELGLADKYPKTCITGIPEEAYLLDDKELGTIINARVAVYEDCQARGVAPGPQDWADAHAIAQAEREEHGYTAGMDGSQFEAILNGKIPYDKDTDYSALMSDARTAGDYKKMHLYELQRNAKIEGEGLADKYPLTHYTGCTQDAMFLPNEELGQIVEARYAVEAGLMDPTQAHQTAVYYRAKNGYDMGPGGDSYRRIDMKEASAIMFGEPDPVQRDGTDRNVSVPKTSDPEPKPSKRDGLPGVGTNGAESGGLEFC